MARDRTGARDLPVVIQGGMGVGVSGWRLARAVGSLGHLGVVSGVALDVIHARRLTDGDSGGHLRRAYAHFPDRELATRVFERWFHREGRDPRESYANVPKARIESSLELRELTVLANFAEVWLAKEGHDGPIGINYLEKIQLPTPDAVYGAMSAGVDYVIVGAGIPADVPRMLTTLAAGSPVDYRISVTGADPAETFAVHFDPADLLGRRPTLDRPRFLAIVSSNTLADFLCKDETTAPDGFVVEGASAGGHNAPPRGKVQFDSDGQPVYGSRDRVDLDRLRSLGRPFWLAGGYADPDRLIEALRLGAAGIQVGTAFALCEESAIEPDLKARVIRAALAGEADVFTDPSASPTGYPFKVVPVTGSLSDPSVYATRRRVCDMGYLRTAHKTDDGAVVYRCASEPVARYVAKGGKAEDTEGRKCLCNGLLATIGLGQVRADGPEAPIITAGDDLTRVVHQLAGDTGRWTAADVIEYLVGPSSIHTGDRARDPAYVSGG